MGMNVGKKSGGAMADINVTPLVDIVLVLLIIFMVLTPSMLKHLDGKMPSKSDSDGNTTQRHTTSALVVEYTRNREVSINGQPVAVTALAEQLRKRLEVRRQKVVFFKADDEAPYGEVVRLMDVARGAGAETLAVVTKAE